MSFGPRTPATTDLGGLESFALEPLSHEAGVWDLPRLHLDPHVSTCQLLQLPGPPTTYDLNELANYLRGQQPLGPDEVPEWHGMPLTRGPQGEMVTTTERALVLGDKGDPEVLQAFRFPEVWDFMERQATAWARDWQNVQATPNTLRSIPDVQVATSSFKLVSDDGEDIYALVLGIKSYTSLDAMADSDNEDDEVPTVWVLHYQLGLCDDDGDWSEILVCGPIEGTTLGEGVFVAPTWKATSLLPDAFLAKLAVARARLDAVFRNLLAEKGATVVLELDE